MELCIYNTYVVMESQEQCDRMKKLCIDNELPYSVFDEDFYYNENHINVFTYDFGYKEFDVAFVTFMEFKRQKHFFITENQFIQLLKSNK